MCFASELYIPIQLNVYLTILILYNNLLNKLLLINFCELDDIPQIYIVMQCSKFKILIFYRLFVGIIYRFKILVFVVKKNVKYRFTLLKMIN
jgi:hypothetical protein